MTPCGLKEAVIIKNDPKGYITFCGDSVHYCESDKDLFDFFDTFVYELYENPSYETK